MRVKRFPLDVEQQDEMYSFWEKLRHRQKAVRDFKGRLYVIPREIQERDQRSFDWAILLAYRGSISHGTYRPNSDPNSIDDKDAIGIVVPPMEYYYGLEVYGSKGTRELKHGEWDIVFYELRKFIGLLEKGNPNVLSCLWLEPNMYMKLTEAGQYLIDNRSVFATKWCYPSFVGYAHGQLHRMTHSVCQGYMGEKRKQLVEKFGFDTKNAAHLIRILRMGIELLSTGSLQVHRPDAEEIVSIKRGEWTLAQVQGEADRLFKLSVESLVRSSLPDEPDRERINQVCCEIMKLLEPA